jgi:hypothetical protein
MIAKALIEELKPIKQPAQLVLMIGRKTSAIPSPSEPRQQRRAIFFSGGAN